MENDLLKVLIGDDTAALGIRFASFLREHGIYAYTRRKDYDIMYNSIIHDKPDVVISDLSFEKSDALMLINKLSSVIREVPPFIVYSDVNNSFIERQVIENGATYFLAAPFKFSIAEKVVRGVAKKRAGYSCQDIEVVVTDVIRKLGIPAHIKGYHYLRCAIISSIQDYHMMDSITKQLYPFVARQYDTTSSRVERAIRHAIELAWDRGSAEELNNYLGYNSDSNRYRPTNSEFIALITDKLRLQFKKKGTFTFL